MIIKKLTAITKIFKNYGLLKCKYSCNIRANKKGRIYMTLKNIMEKLKIVLSSALHQLQDKLSSGMPSWKTVLSFIVYPYRLLFNVVFNHQRFHPKDLMNWNCGIVFLITLLLLLGIF